MRKLSLISGALVVAFNLTACKVDDEKSAKKYTATNEMLVTAAQKTSSVVISSAWVREASSDAILSRAFMTIINGTNKNDMLISVTATFAEKVELHERRMENLAPLSEKGDFAMVMRPVEGGIPVKAGEVKLLEPDGPYAILLMNPKGPLRAGNELEITLFFKEAGMQTVKLPVKYITQIETGES